MRLRVETAVAVGALLAVQLATSFAAIGLLSRTSPAAERILREDEVISATENVLVVLASDGDAEDLDVAVSRVRAVARGADADLVRRIEARTDAAARGDALARLDIVSLAQALADTSRGRMEALDTQARFLGRAGAWTSAMLGVGGFLLSIVVYRRVRARLEAPQLGLYELLEQVRAGDRRRRADANHGPFETRRIAETVNQLLDRVEELQRRPEGERQDRRVLNALLDRMTEPAWVLDGAGQLLATNAAGLKVWDEPGPVRIALSVAIRDGANPPTGWVLEKLGATETWLCRRA